MKFIELNKTVTITEPKDMRTLVPGSRIEETDQHWVWKPPHGGACLTGATLLKCLLVCECETLLHGTSTSPWALQNAALGVEFKHENWGMRWVQTHVVGQVLQAGSGKGGLIENGRFNMPTSKGTAVAVDKADGLSVSGTQFFGRAVALKLGGHKKMHAYVEGCSFNGNTIDSKVVVYGRNNNSTKGIQFAKWPAGK